MPSFALDFEAAWSSWLLRLSAVLTDAGSPFWWPTLGTALIAALIILAVGRRRATGPHPIQPGAASFLKEFWVDLGCFLANGYLAVLIAPFLVAATIAGSTLVILAMGMPINAATSPPDWTWSLAAAALAFVAGDFFLYWTHRAFHHMGPLWALHRLHHNPPALTPLTAFRFWPPEQAVHMLGFNLGVGIGLGLIYRVHGGVVPATSIAGANIFLILWSLAFAHLRHSHIPMSFPGWISRVLVSPHMHQAHHSVAAQHHHRNFGTALALWDWMFGTLHVPAREERFRFGVDAV